MLQAIRGATTAVANEAEAILTAVTELLSELVAANRIGADQLVCAFFSATPDLDAAFPAKAARQLGWTDVALFGMQEQAVRGAPERCVRVMLLHQRPDTPGAGPRPAKPQHVYLRGAQALRPDLAPPQPSETSVQQGSGDGSGASGIAVTSLFGGYFTFYYL